VGRRVNSSLATPKALALVNSIIIVTDFEANNYSAVTSNMYSSTIFTVILLASSVIATPVLYVVCVFCNKVGQH